jgi:hypothetical protein
MTVRTKTFTGADTSLFHIASREYKNALLWNIIADANDLDDYIITGTVQLIIPPKPPSDNGGLPQL